MRITGKYLVAGALALLLGAAGCADLNVTNPNAPDASRALQTPGDIESLISGSYNTWFTGTHSYSGPNMFLSNQSFQHSAPWANSGMVFYGWIPRPAVVNDVADQFYGNFTYPWTYMYRTLSAISDGLKAIEGDTVVANALADNLTRDKAFAKFVQGMATATLGIYYDQGVILDETTDLGTPEAPKAQTPVPYTTLMDTAISYFNKVISLSTAASADFTIPDTWLPVDGGLSNADLAALAHSMIAHFMAASARTPTDLGAADWTTIINNIDAGVDSLTLDDNWDVGWYNEALDYMSAPGWGEIPYWMIGMADPNDNNAYQTWLNTPLLDKAADLNGTNILIVTPDLRFAQGASVDSQMAHPGSEYMIPDPAVDDWNISSVWSHPERQQWRWSYYSDARIVLYDYGENFYQDELGHAQLQLLKAEALYETGDLAGAANIINETRVPAGLNATDAAGTNTSCVPRLPNGNCGDLWEMLKWEKRMNSQFRAPFGAAWYFDSRRWGDLFKDTQLQFPVPCQQLQIMNILPCYSFGGAGGDSSAPVSTYNFPDES